MMHAEAQRQHPEETPEQIEKRVAYRIKHLRRRKALNSVRRALPYIIVALVALLLEFIAFQLTK